MAMGLGLGVIALVVSWVPPVAEAVLVAIVAVGVLLVEAGVLRARLPQNRRQIPSDVFVRRHFWNGALQFGFELGTGVRTYLSNGSAHLLAVALVVLEPPWVVVSAAGLLFGLARALVVVVGSLNRGNLPRWSDRHWEAIGRIAVATGAASALGVALVRIA
jgi:hypothetical protein